MLRYVCLLTAGSMMAGCSADFKLLDNGRSAAFGNATGVFKQREIDLYTAYQQDNRVLRFLSADTYSCGDPREPRARTARQQRTPKQWTSFIDAKLKGSEVALTFIADYADFIKKTADYDGVVQKSSADLSNAAAAVLNVPLALDASGAGKAAGPVVAAIAHWGYRVQLRRVALDLKGTLHRSVQHLKDGYIPKLTAEEQYAFNLWDSCAHERLVYTRDVADGRVIDEAGKVYPSYVSASSGVELGNAFDAYWTKRRQFGDLPDLEDTLTKLEKLNDDLINNNDPGTAADLAATVTTLMNGAAAGENLRDQVHKQDVAKLKAGG